MAYADLVEQQTSTTGTGTYTVSGTAPAGRRTFLAAFPSSTQGIPYVVTDDAGNFECGIGNWTSGAGTLSRVEVLASSNANAAVSWGAGAKRIYVGAHSGVMALAGVRHNLDASATPTDENANDGYGPGSHWYFNGTWWIYNGSYWQKITSERDSNVDEFIQLETHNGNRGALLSAVGALHLGIQDPTDVTGGNDVAGQMGHFIDADGFFTAATSWLTITPDDTPKRMEYWKEGSSWNAALYVCISGVATLEAIVTAVRADDHTIGRAWKVTVAAMNDDAGSMTLGTSTITELVAHASASAWDVDAIVVNDGPTGNGAGIALQVTGDSAASVVWSADVRGNVLAL